MTQKYKHLFIKLTLGSWISLASFNLLAAEETKQPEPKVQPQIQQTQFQDWVLLCSQQAEKKECRLVQSLSVKQDDKTQRLLQATLVKQGEQRLLEILTPLGVDLRPGLLIQVDENPVGTTPYLTCNGAGCFSVINMDDASWSQFRAGKIAKIAFKGVGQPENTVLQLSLKGFTAASKALLEQSK